MMEVEIPGHEFYDPKRNEFFQVKATKLRLEHSLVSISKWESKWKKPFLTDEKKTWEMSIDYVRCMTLTQNVPPEVYLALTPDVVSKIFDYVDTEQTATWFSDRNGSSREIVTSELIYYWMVAYQIPWECQKWHLSRLLTLVRICNIKNAGDGKKMSKSQIMARNRALNAARRKKHHTSG